MGFENEMAKLAALQAKGLFAKPFYAERLAAAGSAACTESAAATAAAATAAAATAAATAPEGPFASYEAFRTLPFMTKNDIRTTPVYDRTATEPGDVFGVFSSSGTTGDRTFYIYNKNDKRVHEEFVRTYLGELGVCPRDLGGIMAPVDTGVMAHTMLWEFQTMGAGYVNCPVPSPRNMLDLLQAVPVTAVATRPDVVSGVFYEPALRGAFAATAVEKLLLGGGFLTEERRALLEEVWGATCYCLFGMSEMFGPMASECRRKDGLHYRSDYLMVELLDPATLQPVADGQPGVAVYTTLWEKGFPLLRYWTDDVFVQDAAPCSCGSALPRLRYKGRLADCCAKGEGAATGAGTAAGAGAKVPLGNLVFAQDVESALFASGLVGEYRCFASADGVKVVSEECDLRTPDAALAHDRLEDIFGRSVELELSAPGALAAWRGSHVRIEVS